MIFFNFIIVEIAKADENTMKTITDAAKINERYMYCLFVFNISRLIYGHPSRRSLNTSVKNRKKNPYLSTLYAFPNNARWRALCTGYFKPGPDLIGQWLYDGIHLSFIKNSDSLNPGTFSDSKVGVVVCVSC